MLFLDADTLVLRVGGVVGGVVGTCFGMGMAGLGACELRGTCPVSVCGGHPQCGGSHKAASGRMGSSAPVLDCQPARDLAGRPRGRIFALRFFYTRPRRGPGNCRFSANYRIDCAVG